jgi:hypothetical protein
MPQQLIIDFTTASSVNIDRLTGQNKRLYDWLAAGNTIHCFHPAMRELRIGYLNSRASDLINKHHVPIHKEWIKWVDSEGSLVSIIEYSLIKY